MNIKETLDYIDHNGKFGIKLGLENMQRLCQYLGHPERNLTFIHVAGTNGKGSFSTMLSAILTEAGYKTGLYTSPALMTFNERIRFNMIPVSDTLLAEKATLIKSVCHTLTQEGFPHPTGYEIETALAFVCFKTLKTDLCILEVGMGGRLDATNIIPPALLSVIMSISKDHTDYLGTTLSAIAHEKAGIFKAGTTALIYPQKSSVALHTLVEDAHKKAIPVIQTNASSIEVLQQGPEGQVLVFSDEHPLIHLLLTLNLAGRYQPLNALTVLKAVQFLREKGYRLSDEAVKTALSSVTFAGRFETLHNAPHILIDGAHNVDGILSLVESLKHYYPQEKFNFFLGMLVDKDIYGALDLLMPLAQEVYTLTPDNARALDAKSLAKLITARYHFPARPFMAYEEAVTYALNQKKESHNIFAGSLYMIGKIKSYLT